MSSQPIPFVGVAHVVFDFEPWKMAFEVEGIDISEDMFLCRLKRAALESSLSLEELLELLLRLPGITLQLLEKKGDIPVTIENCTMAHSDIGPSGLLMSLKFSHKKSELEDILQSLAYGLPSS